MKKKMKMMMVMSFLGSPHIISSIALLLVCCMICNHSPMAHSETCQDIAAHIAYPFAIEEGNEPSEPVRAASPKFLLSNCSNDDGSYPHWNALMNISDSTQTANTGKAPFVLSLNYSSAKINLTWDVNQITNSSSSSSTNSCSISEFKDLPLLLPLSINFKHSIDFSALEVSQNTIILLFNCSAWKYINSTSTLDASSSRCDSFRRDCLYNGLNCIEYTPRARPKLNDTMSSAVCTHFQFFVTHNPSLPVTQWKPHVMQLGWAKNNLPWAQDCVKCQNRNGTCGYMHYGSDFYCFCSSGTNCFNENGSMSRKEKVIIISVVGISAATTIAAILTAFIVYKRFRRKKDSMIKFHANNSRGKLLDKLRSLFSSENERNVLAHEFSYKELREATHSFAYDNMVGDGGFGAVYVGTLKDGRKVAIKKLFYENFQRLDQFCNEIHILSQLNHPNLVKFYGFCCQDERDLLLVFEFAARGSLFDQLHEPDTLLVDNNPIKCWKIRLRIAWETAEALCYLHNFASPPIFHRDVKTSNILLDGDFHAKLADFGISRLVPHQATHISTIPQGTPGYIDPEYYTCNRLTDKSDVYSFGVVLMELLTGRQAVDFCAKSRKDMNLSNLALSKVADGTWHELLDHSCWRSSYHCNSSEPAQIQCCPEVSHHETIETAAFAGLEASNPKKHTYTALHSASATGANPGGCFSLLEENISDRHKNPVVKNLMELAFRCLQPDSADRPNMRVIVEALSNLCRHVQIVDHIGVVGHEPIVLG